MRKPEICARCAKFGIKDHPEQAAHGLGLCSVQWEPTIQPFVRWDAQACVLFDRAKDMPSRNSWIAKQEKT